VSEVKISAELRTEFGKGGARRTRRAGKVPAVLYGHGEKPRHIALPAREFAAAIRHGGMTQVFNIEVSDGTTSLALAKAVQRDPIKDTFEHVDFLVVRRGEKVTIEIPVHLVGEAARETMVMHERNTLAVLADATRLPSSLQASIEGLDVGSQVRASDVTLPEGVELAVDPDVIVAIVAAQGGDMLEAEAAESEAEGADEAADAAAPTPEPAEA
jgi:large subunit ribosomal protein L25